MTKSSFYENIAIIFINTKGQLPDIIFVPVGDGVIISGLFKGFQELKQLGFIDNIPKLIAVQAEGSCAVVEYIRTNTFEYKPAKTTADSISAGAPRNLYMAAAAVLKSGGYGIKISGRPNTSASDKTPAPARQITRSAVR